VKKAFQKFIPKLIGSAVNTQYLFDKKGAVQRAFDIFCTPRKGRVLPDQKSFLNPAKDKTLSAEGVEIQTYVWEGDGPTILLIHGWESNVWRWHKYIPEYLSQGYRVVAFDAPGHGNSSGSILNVPLYTEAINAVVSNYNPDYTVAHSIGALSSIYYFKKFQPTTLKKMVVLGSASELSEIMDDYQRILGLSPKVMRDLEAFLKARFGLSFKTFSGAAFAKAVTVPGLIIHDKHDRITPVSASRAIHKNWKDSSYIETEGLGHSLYQDEVREAIIDFLAAE